MQEKIDETLRQLKESMDTSEKAMAEPDSAPEKSKYTTGQFVFGTLVILAFMGLVISFVWNFVVSAIFSVEEMTFLQGCALYGLVYVYQIFDVRRS